METKGVVSGSTVLCSWFSSHAPQFGYPGMTVGTLQFGIVSSQLNQPRLVQFGLKFTF
jgi:hypothetical protein